MQLGVQVRAITQLDLTDGFSGKLTCPAVYANPNPIHGPLTLRLSHRSICCSLWTGQLYVDTCSSAITVLIGRSGVKVSAPPNQEADRHLRYMGNGRNVALNGRSSQIGWKTASAEDQPVFPLGSFNRALVA